MTSVRGAFGGVDGMGGEFLEEDEDDEAEAE